MARPSPADDFVEAESDLSRQLFSNRPATFLVRVRGQSMFGAKRFDGDLAMVDRSLVPQNGDEVVVEIDGKRSFKVWRREGLGTDHVTVFVHTSEHDRDRPQRSSNITVDCGKQPLTPCC